MATKKIEEDFDMQLPLDMDIDLPSSNIALLFGEINSAKAAKVVSWIIQNNLQEEKPEELALIISSPGGDAMAAYSIIETMRSSFIPIRTIGIGQIASAGLLIFINGTKKRRIITPTCSVMSHHFSTMTWGSYHELSNAQKDLEITHKKILNTYKQCTGRSESYIMKNLLNPMDAWLTPEEAVKHKLADKISVNSYFEE